LLSNELPNPGNDEAGGVDISGSNAGERLPGSKAAPPSPFTCKRCSKDIPEDTPATYACREGERFVFLLRCPNCGYGSALQFVRY